MFFSLFRLVGLLEKTTTNCGLTRIFNNLRFKKQGIGRGGCEYGVSMA
jgi:hypothetical protein